MIVAYELFNIIYIIKNKSLESGINRKNDKIIVTIKYYNWGILNFRLFFLLFNIKITKKIMQVWKIK